MTSSDQKSVMEPEIAPMIQQLCFENIKNPQAVEDKIVQFFRAFDEFKEDQIQRLQAKCESQKNKNKKLRNKQAGALCDKSELENLFLDAIDENRKEVLKHLTNSHNNNKGALGTKVIKRGGPGDSTLSTGQTDKMRKTQTNYGKSIKTDSSALNDPKSASQIKAEEKM